MVHLGLDRWSAWPESKEEHMCGRWICPRSPLWPCPFIVVMWRGTIWRSWPPSSSFLEGVSLGKQISQFWKWAYCIVLYNQRDMAVGSATSDILYNSFPKLTITTRGLDSYIACHFHKYGWPNNTSQTSRGETSHNNSFMKGLMLYGRQHCWLTWRSCPWWSHLMVYGCGCTMVGKHNHLLTSAKMRPFWLPLSIMNFSGELFTHIWEWKRNSSSSRSSGSSF